MLSLLRMIELENAHIFDHNDLVTKTYENGVHYFDDHESYIFSFLTLRFQNLVDGRFTINGTNIFPFSDFTKSLYILTVKTISFIGTTYFVLDKESKKQRINEIKGKIKEAQNKRNKSLNEVVDLFISLNPDYACIDLNNKKNKLASNEISSFIQTKEFQFPVFINSIHEINEKEQEMIKSDVEIESETISITSFSKYISKNGIVIFSLFVLESLAILTGLLIPVFIAKENKTNAIIQIAGLSLCLLFFFTISILSYLVINKKAKNVLKYKFLSSLIAFGLSTLFAVGLFFLFRYGFKFEKYTLKDALLGFIVCGVLLFTNILLPLIKKLINKK